MDQPPSTNPPPAATPPAAMPPAVTPPAPVSTWAAAASAAGVPARAGGVTVLAKVGALILFLFGLFWSAIGVLAIVSGGFLSQLFENVQFEGLAEGQLADFVAGAIVVFGIMILVVAVLEVLVGIFAWRGSGFARVMGILYGLFFGLITLAGVSGSQGVADVGVDGTGGGLVALVIAIAYLYTAAVFIFRYRGSA